MKVKIIKGIYCVISIFLLFIVIVAMLNFQDSSFILYCFSLAVLANPFIMSILLKKNCINEENYISGLKIILSVLGTVIALMIAFIVFYKTNLIYKDEIETNFSAILEICVFIVYLIIIHLCASENKCKNYKIFGIYYCLCVVLSFLSTDITDECINLLNMISGGSMDREDYKILVENFLIPIKEAILTYIILDTVIEYKKKSKIEKKKDIDKQDKINKDYFPV